MLSKMTDVDWAFIVQMFGSRMRRGDKDQDGLSKPDVVQVLQFNFCP